MKSLRVRLFLLVAGLTLAIWAAAATWTAFSTRTEVQRVLDRRLVEAARMVGALDLPATNNRTPVHASQGYSRQLSCQIWSLSGALVGQSAGAPRTPLADGEEGFSERKIDGQIWRVYTHVDRNRGVSVMIGDNLTVRHHLVSEMMMGLLMPAGIGIILLGLLLWVGISRGLRPLDVLTRSIERRSADDLSLIKLDGSPSEITPLIAAMDDLLVRLAHARQTERDFVANAAHELQTPLAGLRTQADVACRVTDPEMRRHALDRIIQSVDRTSHLVRQLLSLARLDADFPKRDPVPIFLDDLLSDIEDDCSDAAAAHHASIVFEPSAVRRVACLDVANLKLALRNLIDNAIRHGGSPIVINASVSDDGDWVEICVGDQGTGIDPSDRERLVRPFERGRAVTAKGSGLGLSIVAASLKREGGHLDLRTGSNGGLIAVAQLPFAHLLPESH